MIAGSANKFSKGFLVSRVVGAATTNSKKVDNRNRLQDVTRA